MFTPQRIPNSITGSFECDYPGCTTLPFHTHYLLKYVCPSMLAIWSNHHSSHVNVHSSPTPHYCPVKDCPRGKGGTGFRRKNELIRHSLIHQVPGYICPYCPDREHKYPRPDDLQRYVKQDSPNRSIHVADSFVLGMYASIIRTKTKTTLCFAMC